MLHFTWSKSIEFILFPPLVTLTFALLQLFLNLPEWLVHRYIIIYRNNALLSRQSNLELVSIGRTGMHAVADMP